MCENVRVREGENIGLCECVCMSASGCARMCECYSTYDVKQSKFELLTMRSGRNKLKLIGLKTHCIIFA